MNNIIFLFLAAGVLVATANAQPAYDFNQIEKQISQKITNKTIPSLTVAVTKNGKIIFEKAYGWADLENKIKATTTTSYQLASLSKPFTATGLMVLNKQGKVNLEDSVESYIEPLKFNAYEGNGLDVKLKHLLNHTSGLGTYFDITYSDEKIKPRDFETTFEKYGFLAHPAGVICEYSNLGYGVIDHIISRKSGTSFGAFMEQEVFGPLGMKNAFVDKTSRPDIIIAKKYDSHLKVLPDVYNDSPGAGSVYASIHDLILFGMFNLKNNVEGQKKILDDAAIDLMQSYRVENAIYHYYDAYYGLGWYYKPNDQGYKIVWHEGGMMGVNSIIELIPSENIAVAVITNTSNNKICQKVKNDILRILLPQYKPEFFNEVAAYKPFVPNPSYSGTWSGTVRVEDLQIPFKLHFRENGDIVAEYIDFTFKSYFTENNPIPHKTVLNSALINSKDYFIGMFPGTVPSNDIRREYSQLMSLKLLRQGNKMTGTLTALAAAEREYYALPFYIQLEKQK